MWSSSLLRAGMRLLRALFRQVLCPEIHSQIAIGSKKPSLLKIGQTWFFMYTMYLSLLIILVTHH